GLFAGVMPVRIGRTAGARFGTRHRIVTRVDGEWLGTLIDRLETHPELLPRLRVSVNSAGFIRGDRFVLPDRPTTLIERPGPLTEVSVRLTRPVRLALEAATAPITVARLAELIGAAFPAAPPEKITGLLAGLVA